MAVRRKMPEMFRNLVAMSPQLHSSLKLGVLQGHEAITRGSNFVFSPLSIRTALGLAANTLHGRELPSMLTFLGAPTLDEINTTSARLIHACRRSDNEALLKISLANGFWADKSMVLKPSFEDTAMSVYKSFIKQVDFQTQYLQTEKEINKWIEKETSSLIKNFLPENTLACKPEFVLANALYFKGSWREEFDISKSKDEDFYLLAGRTHVKVPFMIRRNSNLFFSSFDDFKTLSLPYQEDHRGDRQLSLVVFLPNKRDGLVDLAEKVASDPTFIDRHVPKRLHEVDFAMIPKFKISSKFEVTKPLNKMGLDINGLKTLHGSTIEVDEKGTAAAATTVCLRAFGSKRGGIPPRTCTEFEADHPFMFAIREDVSGAILFYGHVVNPSCSVD